jgi:hypothetical protein
MDDTLQASNSSKAESEPVVLQPNPGFLLRNPPPDWETHETVVGLPGDEVPPNDGLDGILKVITLFETTKIPCCIIDVIALQYYGARRVRWDVSGTLLFAMQ